MILFIISKFTNKIYKKFKEFFTIMYNESKNPLTKDKIIKCFANFYSIQKLKIMSKQELINF